MRCGSGRRLLAMMAASCAALAACADALSAPPAARFVTEVPWTGRGTWLRSDTHIHTRFSDGANLTADVVDKAAEYGCDAVAITDHSDDNLRGATPAYFASLAEARSRHPDTVILPGVEWNVPPWGGDEHAAVLVAPGPGDDTILAEFKARFDDLHHGAERHTPVLADEALRWLAANPVAGVAPVVVYNHPSRRDAHSIENVADLQQWRRVNDTVIGFEGGPGHQNQKPLGAYQYREALMDRWDPAVARVGDAWDTLLGGGMNLWGAYASSDFHNAGPNADYWPCQFSETWLYAPNRTAKGALSALRAGSFFADHGRIVREVELLVEATGLRRPAGAGEAIAVPAGSTVTAKVRMQVPPTDWAGQPNRIDAVELVAITTEGARIAASRPPLDQPEAFIEAVPVPPGGIVLRARGRRDVPGGPNLMFYTNPVRISVGR